MPAASPSRVLDKVHAHLEKRAALRFSQVLTDQVSGFISGGLDRERHMYWDWLSASGLVAEWLRTDYGRKRPQELRCKPD